MMACVAALDVAPSDRVLGSATWVSSTTIRCALKAGCHHRILARHALPSVIVGFWSLGRRSWHAGKMLWQARTTDSSSGGGATHADGDADGASRPSVGGARC